MSMRVRTTPLRAAVIALFAALLCWSLPGVEGASPNGAATGATGPVVTGLVVSPLVPPGAVRPGVTSIGRVRGLSTTLAGGTRASRGLRLLNFTDHAVEVAISVERGPHNAARGGGRWKTLAPSPRPLSQMVADPDAGRVYAISFGTREFYRYVPEADRWDRMADAPFSGSEYGSAALLDGKIYLTGLSTVLGVYEIATDLWSTISNPATWNQGNTSTVASDGEQYLYLLGEARFVRFEPVSQTTQVLTPPDHCCTAGGGFAYNAGRVFAHTVNGTRWIMTYDIAADTWRRQAMPDNGTRQGAAIDPVEGAYYTASSGLDGTLTRYDIGANAWSVSAVTATPISTGSPFNHNGGLAWLPSPVPTLFVAEGGTGNGFARRIRPYTVSVSADSAVVPAGGAVEVGVQLDAEHHEAGSWPSTIRIVPTDESLPEIDVPADLEVTGRPSIAMERWTVRSAASSETYSSDGAVTEHVLPTPTPPAAGVKGTLEVVGNGDFGHPTEVADVSVDGEYLGTLVGEADCVENKAVFELPPARLAAIVADGEVHVTVDNSAAVNVGCVDNLHWITLRYHGSGEHLDFGAVENGQLRTLALRLVNKGNDTLRVTSVQSGSSRFSVYSQPSVVPPGSFGEVLVGFWPSPGAHVGTITVQSDDPQRGTVLVTVEGTGI